MLNNILYYFLISASIYCYWLASPMIALMFLSVVVFSELKLYRVKKKYSLS